jgi:hypothetical protein
VAILAGIDEAGLGPLLGPLVVSAAAFELPEEDLEVSLWSRLASCVSRKSPRRAYRLHIADSKKVFNRSKGQQALEPLERAVLAMLLSRRGRVDCLRHLLGQVCPDATDQFHEYPWYRDDLALPLSTTAMQVQFSCNALRAAMERSSLRLVRLSCRPLPAGHFNRMLEVMRNKSAAAFSLVARLMAEIVDQADPGQRVVIWVDRQGGRMRYLSALERLWPGGRWKIVSETEQTSAYRLELGQRQVDLIFRVQAEDVQLPVALASMASKYLRELFMHQFNGFWRRELPELAPTAGYFADGRRFYDEIRDRASHLGIDETLLLRMW